MACERAIEITKAETEGWSDIFRAEQPAGVQQCKRVC